VSERQREAEVGCSRWHCHNKPTATDLISSTIKVAPGERPRAEQLLQHAWISKPAPATPIAEFRNKALGIGTAAE